MANRRQALERARVSHTALCNTCNLVHALFLLVLTPPLPPLQLSHGILLDCRVTDAALSEAQEILGSLEAQGAK